MMKKILEILSNSLRLAMLELRNNKLRTTLSLLGVTFGIFCIIGVLATVNSLETNIQNDINALGSTTVYIDKWKYGGGGSDYPWWKYQQRPEPKYQELELLKKVNPLITKACFVLDNMANVESSTTVLNQVEIWGPAEGFPDLQPFELSAGRYFTGSEMTQGSPLAVLGNENAELLFGTPEKAIGKEIKVKNQKVTVIGVVKKKGKSLVGGWTFDQAVIMPYQLFRQIFVEKYSSPKIMVQGPEGMPLESFRDELQSSMRKIRKLGPTDEDNFTLNLISDFSKSVSGFFANVSMGGWFIGILSLIVGAFSIANIMFVTVRERTAIIGLKKAIGAKKTTILTEFLLESSFICLLGGAIGLIMVFLLTFLLTKVFEFPVFISFKILSLALGICITIGIAAGIIPASIAARLDPVVAIRSK